VSFRVNFVVVARKYLSYKCRVCLPICSFLNMRGVKFCWVKKILGIVYILYERLR